MGLQYDVVETNTERGGLLNIAVYTLFLHLSIFVKWFFGVFRWSPLNIIFTVNLLFIWYGINTVSDNQNQRTVI